MHLNNFLRTNRRFKFKLLPIKKFPNGRFWYEKRDIVDPNYHLVHYNCVLHDKKKDLMIKDNHWLLNNEDFDEDESQSKV